jgi:hypothetical protein
MTTKKIKELDILPVEKQKGKYNVLMSFSVPDIARDLGNVSVQLTDQNGVILWGPYLITESPVEVIATFTHTNLTKVILWRYLSNAYGVTSHKFDVYWLPMKTVTFASVPPDAVITVLD